MAEGLENFVVQDAVRVLKFLLDVVEGLVEHADRNRSFVVVSFDFHLLLLGFLLFEFIHN